LGWNGLAASLTYFYTDFKDKIVTDSLPSGAQSWQNLGDATIAGFETNLSYDIGEPLEWSWEVRPYFQATFLTEYKDEETNDDLLYTSGTQYSTGIKVNNGNGIFCQLNVNHTGSQDVQDWESGASPTPIVKLDSFTIADFTASWRFYENEVFGAFTVRGDVTNIFDKEYAYAKGYPMPGRGFFVSLRWDY
jgi:vitamin B12 transporter